MSGNEAVEIPAEVQEVLDADDDGPVFDFLEHKLSDFPDLPATVVDQLLKQVNACDEYVEVNLYKKVIGRCGEEMRSCLHVAMGNHGDYDDIALLLEDEVLTEHREAIVDAYVAKTGYDWECAQWVLEELKDDFPADLVAKMIRPLMKKS